MAKQTIDQLVADAYDDRELAAAVLADIKRLGTAGEILSGDKVLPSPQDARNWYERDRREVAARKATSGQ